MDGGDETERHISNPVVHRTIDLLICDALAEPPAPMRTSGACACGTSEPQCDRPMEIVVESIEHLHSLFAKKSGWVYRGHSRSNWELVPKAGRAEYSLASQINSLADQFDDLTQFKLWCSTVYSLVDDLPEDFGEALAYAQHHGLATRLLDWSENPLVATFFAVRENPESDGAICAFRPSEPPLHRVEIDWLEVVENKVNRNDEKTRQIVARLHGRLLKTRAMDARMLNQGGVFTLHCPPERPMATVETYVDHDGDPDCEEEIVERYIIRAGSKWELQRHLNLYGINDAFTFPDADGVALMNNFDTKSKARGQIV